jgi:hypothetical protein
MKHTNAQTIALDRYLAKYPKNMPFDEILGYLNYACYQDCEGLGIDIYTLTPDGWDVKDLQYSIATLASQIEQKSKIKLSRRAKLDVINTLTENDIKAMAKTCDYDIINLLAHYCNERVQM